MGVEVLAGLELEQIVIPVISGLIGVVMFFATKFFDRSEKTHEKQVDGVTHIALIHEKIGQLSSSDAKQWTTLDQLMREMADMKLKIAVLEHRKNDPR